MVLTGLGGVAAGVLLFLLVLKVAGPRSTEQSEEARFRVGPAERWSQTVAREGPLLFQDLLSRSRDIYVNHLGGNDWRAFEAHAPGAPRRCTLQWRPDSRDFVDPCDGRTFPADGTGLTQYPATVTEDGVLVVDL
jgi:hypothetical protein